MTTDTLLTAAFSSLLGSGGTAMVFVLTGGYKKQRQETESQLVGAIKEAGEFLAKSNENLRNDIKELSDNYEHKIKDLVKKFELKEKEYILRIENLELENKNLKLENANLALQNSRLINEAGMRRLG